jgi:NADPH:quinone reductase-like Zn-dependent oxidoreductase
MSSKALNEVLRIAQNSPLFTAASVLAAGLSTFYLFQSRQSRRTSKIPLERERVLILGATSGVGRMLAQKYASRGAFVCIVGRRQPKIDEVVQECKELSERGGFEDRVLGVRGDCGDVKDMTQLRETLQNGQ